MTCKICGGSISVFEHTAKCSSCGVLLYYPYLSDDELLLSAGSEVNDFYVKWYNEASFLNHTNFTNMFRYVFDCTAAKESFSILDYGGGGGSLP